MSQGLDQSARFELPASIAHFAGRMLDVDQHECIPINLWVDEFGAVAQPMIDAYAQTSIEMRRRTEDKAEINADTVFKTKLEDAPGAFDLSRRLKVMDFIGLDRALVYPGTLAMISISLYCATDRKGFAGRIDVSDLRLYGRQLQDGYNDWCLRAAKVSDRIRPVAVLTGETPQDMFARAKALIAGGIRAIWIPSGFPPAGLSPAHPAHDPLWALLADADCPVVDHVGGQSGFLVTEDWRRAPAFEGWSLGGEFSMDPWTLSTKHFAPQSFVSSMVIGGVFERYPTLRYGTAELTGHWVGPTAEMLDMWLANKPFRSSAGERVLTMQPSEYIRRNVRVGCFDFEPVDRYISRFGFEEVYCYCSDYPHAAGGENPIGVAARTLGPLGPETLRRFFVDNGRFLLPD